MMRYGESDFDLDYVHWGFQPRDEQIREAESLLGLVSPSAPIKILDLGCGLGTHDIYWAQRGHDVYAEDISRTFIERARSAAQEAGVSVRFICRPIEELAYADRFDLVTAIGFFPHDPSLLRAVCALLRPGGRLIFDVRNPGNPKSVSRSSDYRTWEERDGKFYLERHETDAAQDRREDVWITIDPDTDLIEERVMESKDSESKLALYSSAGKLLSLGFARIEFRTAEGELFETGDDPYWLWCVATKGPGPAPTPGPDRAGRGREGGLRDDVDGLGDPVQEEPIGEARLHGGRA
jgi:SAM-dependent methyltransferase